MLKRQPAANWTAFDNFLSAASGQENPISVHEVLDIGSGDISTQNLPASTSTSS
ncbi:hypothetical protein ABT013_22610 [Streptomyces bacillaris]|uniref:hypothetical protein n=1 Tax=Streptomyces bacillaris TaxID=68179 RepID=UPI00334D9ACD